MSRLSGGRGAVSPIRPYGNTSSDSTSTTTARFYSRHTARFPDFFGPTSSYPRTDSQRPVRSTFSFVALEKKDFVLLLLSFLSCIVIASGYNKIINNISHPPGE